MVQKPRGLKSPVLWVSGLILIGLVVGAIFYLRLPTASPGPNPYQQKIGSNGQQVFVDPAQALAQAKRDYKEGFAAIRKEFGLLPLNSLNYRAYMNYGWQLTIGDEEVRRQGMEITKFFDIYENSFK